jgi:acyl-CoA thioester hydrolase
MLSYKPNYLNNARIMLEYRHKLFGPEGAGRKNRNLFAVLGCGMDIPERITIQSHRITIVPRYSETDQAGVVHHSVYPVWFEMGRTELLRANGMAYKDLEKAGVFFVVARLEIKYRRPAQYDEELELETTCSTVTSSRVEHEYQLTRCSDGVIIAEGSSALACVDSEGKVRRMPEFMYVDSELSC